MTFSPAIVQKLRERAERYAQLTEELSSEAVASDGRRLAELLREQGQLARANELCDRLEELLGRRAEAEELVAGDDEEMVALAQEELDGLPAQEESLDSDIKDELSTDADLLRKKVIVEVRSGTGGDEATLFAGDLFRMYQRYFEARRWKLELLDAAPSEVGGFREIHFAVEGEEVWKFLRFESGTHRVQRVPQTESQGRIHTSAATVAVLPEAEEVDVQIKDEDLRIDTMRASGPGGQSVNKTSSAVRITHLPTNTVVSCQDEKSQHKNKAKAMRILRARLFDAERQRVHDERAAARKSQVGSGDRSERIRTYNWPQNRVSDHRLGQNFSLEQVVAGKLQPILDALEDVDREQRIAEL